MVLQVLVVLLSVVSQAAHGSRIRALNGVGDAVAWWAVLKLPSHVHSPSGLVIPTPCDCPVPDCHNVATAGWEGLAARATGLCYLYADSTAPEFRYFRDAGYECLGQGGDDPLSHTLKQRETSAYWAVFNDQLDGIAATYRPNDTTTSSETKNVCGGTDLFSGHAKGAVAFQSDESGGVYLQTSTPNYPDPTRNDSFVPLGCQVDNNVHFAQHLVAMSFDDTELKTLGEKLQLARLCSSNFYTTANIQSLLRSDQLDADGQTHGNSSAAAFYQALLNPQLRKPEPLDPLKAEVRLKLAEETRDATMELLSEERDHDVHVLVKSPRATVPPWALVAEMLESDISVASWWDGAYGIPTICAGDVYSHAPLAFCLQNPATGVELNADGSAPFNIENLLQATWRMRDGSPDLTWHLLGGPAGDGNHAKWGVTTPRSGHANVTTAFVTFGDLNMEGFPCSTTCSGAQAGRGGTFFSFRQPQLHKSLTESVVSKACRCVAPTRVSEPPVARSDPRLAAFEHLRMCQHGCTKKVDARLEPSELPILSRKASSFWTE